jgi:hypothetical protein
MIRNLDTLIFGAGREGTDALATAGESPALL